MKLVFFNWAFEDHGSAQDLYHYARAAETIGHQVIVYGRPNGRSSFDYSIDLESADAAIFIFEYSTYVDKLDAVRLVGRIPRERRVVIDCDGGYNDAITFGGDVNHADEAAGTRWREVCESLSDKIVQPTFHPRQPKASTFFFHAYNPDWEVPLDFSGKRYGMCYVGNTWFRWRGMRRVLGAVEPVREHVGPILLIGNGWDRENWQTDFFPSDEAYKSDPDYLRELGVELVPPVRFDRVIECMGLGVFMPVIYRPLFDHLRLVTCRTFETPAANTLPLFCQEPEFVSEVYGQQALELVLPDVDPHEKILDLVERPDHYAGIVEGVRAHLRENYSYRRQLERLVELVEA